jgi:hypothetical protein
MMVSRHNRINDAVVWVFPQLLICLECGFTEFVVPDAVRQKLKDLSKRDGTMPRAG